MYGGMTARDNLGLIATQLHYLYCEARIATQLLLELCTAIQGDQA